MEELHWCYTSEVHLPFFTRNHNEVRPSSSSFSIAVVDHRESPSCAIDWHNKVIRFTPSKTKKVVTIPCTRSFNESC